MYYLTFNWSKQRAKEHYEWRQECAQAILWYENRGSAPLIVCRDDMYIFISVYINKNRERGGGCRAPLGAGLFATKAHFCWTSLIWWCLLSLCQSTINSPLFLIWLTILFLLLKIRNLNFFSFLQENVFRFDLRKLVANAFTHFTAIVKKILFFQCRFTQNKIQ